MGSALRELREVGLGSVTDVLQPEACMLERATVGGGGLWQQVSTWNTLVHWEEEGGATAECVAFRAHGMYMWLVGGGAGGPREGWRMPAPYLPNGMSWGGDSGV